MLNLNKNPVYKGRCVFRGDDVTDETGYHAVFSEQGASASHLQAGNFLNAIARIPGDEGEDADARSAYTHVILAEMRQMPDYDGVGTWMSLPRGVDQRVGITSPIPWCCSRGIYLVILERDSCGSNFPPLSF